MPIRVIFCLPDNGWDPTEASIPFEMFQRKGWEPYVATENGAVAACDERMRTGWLSKIAGAKSDAQKAYQVLVESPAFKKPLSWSSEGFTLLDYDVVILPGGHAKGVKQLIESESLKPHLAAYFPLTAGDNPQKLCGAICHGVMALAWTKREDGKSILYNRRTTTLPVHLERLAYFSTALVLGNYYRTYPGIYTADAVKDCLESPLQYEAGPWNFSTSYDEAVAHIVKDGGYISARWPGDAFVWSCTICENAEKLWPQKAS